MDVTARRAARILLVDEAHRVLLLHGFDPLEPVRQYWFTVGGGLEPGESAAEGAARELAEETGLRVGPAQVGRPVWQEVAEFAVGGRHYRQEQEYFLLRVGSWEVVTDGFDEFERGSIDAHRWWSLAELEHTTQTVYPRELPTLLRRLLAAGKGEPC